MSDKEFSPAGTKKFWFVDLLVVVIFLSTALVCVYLFRQDLLRTLDARDEESVGLIIIRHNVIQRRYSDRVIWERLFIDSPVYSGDLIRAAELSDATIHLGENQIGLNENTLIRIQQSHDGSGSYHVDLREGNLSVTTGAGTGIILNIMGHQVQASPGTVLNAELKEEGMVVQVSEGSAFVVEEGESRELTEGTMIAKDSSGVELKVAAAVITRPQPNARYLKNSSEPLLVDFVWRRINLSIGETLRLETASDKNFTKDLHSVDGLDSTARAYFNAGNWYWRLSFQDAVLSRGELTVVDASGPELFSPAAGSMFRYQNDPPQIRFQWSERSGASRYNIEVCENQDFINSKINSQLVSTSFIQSELGHGTWYWRVQPVFPSTYDGAASYSATGYFQIEQTGDPGAPVFALAEELSETARVIPPPAPKPPEPAPVNAPSSVRADPPVPVVAPSPVRIDPPAPAPSGGHRYAVKSGDTLSRIAAREYGDAALWRKIFEANDNIQNPDLIFIDQELYIP